MPWVFPSLYVSVQWSIFPRTYPFLHFYFEIKSTISLSTEERFDIQRWGKSGPKGKVSLRRDHSATGGIPLLPRPRSTLVRKKNGGAYHQNWLPIQRNGNCSHQLSTAPLFKKMIQKQYHSFPSGPHTLKPVNFLNITSINITIPYPKKVYVVEKLLSIVDEVTRAVEVVYIFI